jgi:dTDP-D-glucose 4,6-dehydratase
MGKQLVTSGVKIIDSNSVHYTAEDYVDHSIDYSSVFIITNITDVHILLKGGL